MKSLGKATVSCVGCGICHRLSLAWIQDTEQFHEVIGKSRCVVCYMCDIMYSNRLSLLLGDLHLEVDVVVAVAVAVHVLDAFALKSDALVRLHPWRNLMGFY